MTGPAADGLFMPAEWEPHDACWMAWPCRAEAWGDGYEAACRAYAQVARTIVAYEPVRMLTRPEHVPVARLQLGRRVEIVPAELDDSWTRDTLPTFLVDGRGGTAAVTWRFNAWGNKYHRYDRDALLGQWLSGELAMRRYDGPMVLEGGSIHVDGAGTVLAVEPTILNANRNPTLDRRQVEERLVLHLGCTRILWLEHGLSGDETDGHVDNVARFVGAGTAMACIALDAGHPDHHRLNENRARLAAARDAAGRRIEVVDLPMPQRSADVSGRAVMSYLNFYIANGAVVVPRFGDEMDDVAARIVGQVFPDRAVAQVDAIDIVAGGGGIHCITREQPAGTPLR